MIVTGYSIQSCPRDRSNAVALHLECRPFCHAIRSMSQCWRRLNRGGPSLSPCFGSTYCSPNSCIARGSCPKALLTLGLDHVPVVFACSAGRYAYDTSTHLHNISKWTCTYCTHTFSKLVQHVLQSIAQCMVDGCAGYELGSTVILRLRSPALILSYSSTSHLLLQDAASISSISATSARDPVISRRGSFPDAPQTSPTINPTRMIAEATAHRWDETRGL
ncbi:hypothetical protein K504DRAFT_142284 [Pleomassaria siparia CBS 279.74]|uniref:Uncharacterized protein n=1 Tax=Pleomassaria siparia CBS 279.74 TaxID=1314801 RepID=A0A6G1KM43_9PLEO|nr:hypothetical protein K504DRAFT_142284 [Pleomassaria siparia CBS 279.74]